MVKLIKKDKKKKGFTLIELVAVVAIIGILAALLVPKISGYIDDAKKTKVIDQARQVYMAVETSNTKNDVQIPASATVDSVIKNKSVYKYMGLSTGGTVGEEGSTFPNLNKDMTIEECKNIIEGNDFEIEDGVFKK